MIFKPNQQYSDSVKPLKSVRDCIEGEPTIKRLTTEYLKHPSSVDISSDQALQRYSKYIEGAEFDGFPGTTESSMLGKMKAGDADIEFPPGVDYLESNSDGDGVPMTGLIEILYKNLLEAKFHVLLAEMDSLASVDTETLSVADLKILDPKATIKSYTREAMIDWDFKRINGVLQLSLLVLKEEQSVRSDELVVNSVTTYLVLGLDEVGYYQQKYIEGDKGEFSASDEKLYPSAGGQKLQFIPAQIVGDEAYAAGTIPKGMGYLYPICSAALSRYSLSADYKESLRFMQPTTFTKGWKQGDKELFKALNDREHIAFGVGVANNLPNNVEVDIKGIGVESEAYERYLEANESKARALGASFDTGKSKSNTSATESAINESNQTAAMSSIVENVEAALTRVSSYCAMFMGLWAPDKVMDNLGQFKIDLYDDFGKVKMTAEDQAAVVNNVMAMLYSRDEGVRILVRGGVTVSDAETIMGEASTQGPQPIEGASTPETETQ